MKEIKALGTMQLPATHATKVMDPHAQTQQLTVWEIEGDRYVVISGNTRGKIEFSRIADLYVDSFDGLLKSSRSPLRVRKEDLAGYAGVIPANLPTMDTVDIPNGSGAPATSDAQLRASAKYDAENTTKICLKFNDKTDADILKKLSEVDSKQGYIKALIREDLLKG